MSWSAIGREVGVAASTVRAAFDRHGVPTRTDRMRDRAWLAGALADGGVAGAAADAGVSTATVRRWMARHSLRVVTS